MVGKFVIIILTCAFVAGCVSVSVEDNSSSKKRALQSLDIKDLFAAGEDPTAWGQEGIPFDLDPLLKLDRDAVMKYAKDRLDVALSSKGAAVPQFCEVFAVHVLTQAVKPDEAEYRKLGGYFRQIFNDVDKNAQYEILFFANDHKLPQFADAFIALIEDSLSHKDFLPYRNKPVLAALYFQKVRSPAARPLLEKLEREFKKDDWSVVLNRFPYNQGTVGKCAIPCPLDEVRKALANCM